MRVIGVDGCRGGWLAVALDDDDSAAWQWTADAAQVVRAEADAVAIDIPIGLPDAGSRACDRAARAMLGHRGVSVFPAPVRAVLGCVTYADARAVLADLGGPSMSAQAFGIMAGVRAVDDVLSREDETRVVEAHPEVAFSLMGSGSDLPGKRTVAGVALRLRLLASWLPSVLDVLADVPARAGLDDALDALACAWVARRWVRGAATVLGDGSRDARGLAMRIVA